MAMVLVMPSSNQKVIEPGQTVVLDKSASASPMVIIIGSPTDEDDTSTGLIIRGYYPVKNQATLGLITKAQSSLPTHVTKQLSSATQITA